MNIENFKNNKNIGAVMIVGGGIGGMQSALDLAETGIKVYLVDTKPCIGGVMSQLDKTFPTNDCAMCTMAPRLVEIGRHKDIEIITLTDIENITGEAGNFSVTLKKKARYINEEKCTGCGLCVNNCPVRNQIYIIPEEEKIKIRLTLEDEVIVNKIIEEHKYKKGYLMLILQSLNTAYNYFPENALRYISQEINLPLSLILRVATFYNAFSLKPKGKYTVNVCMGTTCYVRGGEILLNKFSELLGINVDETTKDKLFTLKSVRCIGCCGLAPAVAVGDETYGKLSIKDIPVIIDKYKKKDMEDVHAQTDNR